MNSHFSVILLCFSGVYCISSTIENLDLDGLKRILNGQTAIKEWDAAMDQDIVNEDSNNIKTTINVRNSVRDFVRKAEDGDVVEFESIHNIIKRAYQCTLTKYASLTAFLIVQDLCELTTIYTKVIHFMMQSSMDFNLGRLLENDTFQIMFNKFGTDKYHLDFDIKFHKRFYQFNNSHDFVDALSKEWYKVWASIIEKKLGLKIKYKVYTDVMRKNFTNPYDQHVIGDTNELVCVLNEAIQVFDNFIVDKCVQHGGSFVKNFESLKTGVNQNLMLLITRIDKLIAGGAKLELYRDFSKPIAGPSRSTGKINASGCFVENVEIEISGLKTDLKNKKNSTEIYGRNIDARIPEPVILKLIESIQDEPREVKLGMLLVRDDKNDQIDGPSEWPSE